VWVGLRHEMVSDHVELEKLHPELHHNKPGYLGLESYLDVLGRFEG
jgi:hypothetical protein